MKIPIIACAVSVVTALLVGIAGLAIFVLGLYGDMSDVIGLQETHFSYAALPMIVSMGFSMAFAHWRLFTAHVFAIIFTIVFWTPVIFLTAISPIPRWNELIGFLVMMVLSTLTNWHVASLVKKQLRQADSSEVNSVTAL